MATFGIEEEIFITEPERPTLRSLYYLAKLLAKDPRFYYTHSAHNFTRGADLKQGMMSGVEISTAAFDDIEALVDDLAFRRQQLADVTTNGLLVPLGHLMNMNTPTNTCAIHIHIGGIEDKKKLYNNILHFLPILPLFTASSPMVENKFFGKSYRMSCSFAIGKIKPDWEIRFQDVIHSKRLGTIELRACDPCWDLNRVKYLLKAIKAISELEKALAPNIEMYNNLRDRICIEGIIPETKALVYELKELVDFPEEMLLYSASDELNEIYCKEGLLGCYSALDNGYRNGKLESREVTQKQRAHIISGIIGFAGYFLPRFPYYAWKGLREN